jgi:hypothetical protein
MGRYAAAQLAADSDEDVGSTLRGPVRGRPLEERAACLDLGGAHLVERAEADQGWHCADLPQTVRRESVTGERR